SPLIPFIRMSISRMSGRSARYCSSASVPLCPVPDTVMSGSASRMVFKDAQTSASSSISRTFIRCLLWTGNKQPEPVLVLRPQGALESRPPLGHIVKPDSAAVRPGEFCAGVLNQRLGQGRVLPYQQIHLRCVGVLGNVGKRLAHHRSETVLQVPGHLARV